MAAIQLAGLEAYNEDTWARLPEDRLAFTQSRENPLSESVSSEIGQIFVKNGVHNRLSLYLAHRHFALNPGEAVVEAGNVATPWPLQSASEAVRTTVAAKSWMFVDGKLAPFEFAFSGEGQVSSTAVPADFVNELGNCFHRHGLEGKFGITVVDDLDMKNLVGGVPSMYETTIGRVSLAVSRFDAPAPEGLTDVAWKFDGDGHRVSRACLKCCVGHG